MGGPPLRNPLPEGKAFKKQCGQRIGLTPAQQAFAARLLQLLPTTMVWLVSPLWQRHTHHGTALIPHGGVGPHRALLQKSCSILHDCHVPDSLTREAR